MGYMDKLNINLVKAHYALVYVGLFLLIYIIIINFYELKSNVILELTLINGFLLLISAYLYAENNVNKLAIKKINNKLFPKENSKKK